MANDSPAVIVYDSNGVEVTLPAGSPIPTGTRGILLLGSDGTAARVLLLDSSGRPLFVGAGTPGSPSGGVVSIQGVAGGQPLPISGSITAVNDSVGLNSSVAPTSSTQIGGKDGSGNLQAASVISSSPLGSEEALVTRNIPSGVQPVSFSGSIDVSDRSARLLGHVTVDSSSLPTGAATEATLSTRAAEHTTAVSPNSTRLTDGTTFYKATTPSDTQPISAVSLPLPTGAATETTLSSLLADSTFTGRINTQGQKAMAASTPVVIADDQSTINVSASIPGTVDVSDRTARKLGAAFLRSPDDTVNIGDATNPVRVDPVGTTPQPVNGTITANVGTTGGLALDTTLTSGAQKSQIVDGADTLDINASGQAAIQNPPNLDVALSTRAAEHTTAVSPHAARLTDGTAFYKATTPSDTQPISAVALPLPAGASTEATLASILSQLDVALSTRASQATLASILGQLDVALSTRASQATLATRASEATVASILAQLDVALSTRLADATFTARINTLGQKLMATSTPVVIASDQSSIDVTASIPGTVDVSDRAARLVGHVTVDSSALPAGAATEATLAAILSDTTDIKTSVANLDVALSTRASESTLSAIKDTDGIKKITDQLPAGTNTIGKVDQGVGGASAWKVDGSAVTQPISAVSLPLPAGAATSANQTTIGSQTTKINDGTNTASVTAANALKVDNSAVTQPISAVSLPLPTGASQEHITAASPNSTRLSDGASFYDAAKTGQLPAALVGGRLDENVGAWLGSTAPTVGQKTSANSVPVIIASDQSAVPISGTVTANQGGAPWSQNVAQVNGATVSVNNGATDSGTIRVTVSNDSTGLIKLATGSNTIGSLTANQSINVNQIAGTTVDANTGNASSGTQRVVLASNQPTIPVTASPAADIAPSTINITIQDTASTTTTGANNQSIITGVPTANSAATFSLSTLETAQVQVTGTWTGTLQVEVSPDNGTTYYIRRIHQTGTDAINSSFTSNFSGGSNTAGMTHIRVRATAAMTGTAIVLVRESLNQNIVYLANANRITDNSGNYQPAMDSTSRAGFGKVTDGTNVAAVKAASTAPLLADPALVVNVSPSRPATYAASTNGVVAASNNATATTSIAYLFHTASNTKRIEIYRITVTSGLETGANHDFSIRCGFITAENATPGGTAETANPLDRDDAASTITSTTGVFRVGATGAPTRVTGDLISEEMYMNTAYSVQKELFDVKFTGKPIVLRANVAEGFEVRTVGNNNGNLAQSPSISVTMFWMEI